MAKTKKAFFLLAPFLNSMIIPSPAFINSPDSNPAKLSDPETKRVLSKTDEAQLGISPTTVPKMGAR